MPTIQLNAFDSSLERDKGIEKAVKSAEEVCPDWKEKAWDMFKSWLSGWARGHEFMIEDFRLSAEIQGLPKPRSGRAYGAIAVRGKKEGLIISYKTEKTTNKNAHRANAALWVKV